MTRVTKTYVDQVSEGSKDTRYGFVLLQRRFGPGPSELYGSLQRCAPTATREAGERADRQLTKTTEMEIRRELVDRDFDRYVLSAEGVAKHEATLPAAVLQPLDAANTTRKTQWEARVHHNALAGDAFRSEALGGSVAYYVDAQSRLVQVIKAQEVIKAQVIYELPQLAQRAENVSLRVAGKGLIVLNDGSGTVRLLKSGNADAAGGPWEILYEFQPLENQASLLLQATYNDPSERFEMFLAEPLASGDKDAAFRLWVVQVSCATTSDSMDVDSGAVGMQHTAFELAISSTLPDYITFVGGTMAVLVEGSCNVMIESNATVALSGTTQVPPAPSSESPYASKRHHDDTDEMDIDEVLSKLPRAGIGYHGDVSDTKHPNELAHNLDLEKPLGERFRKSNIPFSSLDEPLHSTAPEAVRSPTSQAREGTLEVPTPDTILGGFEECDDVDPNAKAVLLLVDTESQTVQDRLDINCRTFRYLSKSTQSAGAVDSALLFQNDVHGLVYNLDISASRLSLCHVATFPAFGFVQASKQDKKYMTFRADARFACIGEFEKRVFVYHGAPAGQEKTAHVRKQNVVEIGDHQLLGMCTVGSSILLLSAHHAYAIDVMSLS